VSAGAVRHALDGPAALVLDWCERGKGRSATPARWARSLTDQQPVIDADVARWDDILGLPDDHVALPRLFYAFPQFRSLFYYRLGKGNPAGALAARLLARAWPGVPGLDLAAANAAAGLFISHGHGTVISAQSMGRNCYVHHGVTVGWDYRGDRLPVIGDGVFIGAGAKILGAVTVGDYARVGANAVVMSDVPAGTTAVGAPARVVAGSR
jgi:serine O-acetyltransferase